MKSLVKNLIFKNIQQHIPVNDGMRFFKIAIYLFYAAPILFVSYLYLQSNRVNQSFFTPIINEPIITIMFVVAMLNPFCGLLTKFALQDLKVLKQDKLSLVTLQMMAVSQMLAGNIFGSMALWLGLYKHRKTYGNLCDDCTLYVKNKGSVIKLSGSIAVLSLSLLCTFFLIKISFY